MHPSVLILFNNPGASAHSAAWLESDAGVEAEAVAVASAIGALGLRHRSIGVSSLAEVGDALRDAREPVVFNLVEQLAGGPADACLVPAACARANKAFTGGDAACLRLCLDKARSKKVFQRAGIPTPAWVVVKGGRHSGQVPPAVDARVIVKPADMDASEGIGSDAVIEPDDPSLPDAVSRVSRLCGGGPVLIESFVDGREVNVSILEIGGKARSLPLAEIEFAGFPPGKPRIVDYAAKWKRDSFEYRNTVRRVPADFDGLSEMRIRETALKAWRATGCRGYARVDFRIAADGTPYVLEVNPNPDISPDAGFAAALRAAGISYGSFVEAMIGNAMERAPGGIDGKVPMETA